MSAWTCPARAAFVLPGSDLHVPWGWSASVIAQTMTMQTWHMQTEPCCQACFANVKCNVDSPRNADRYFSSSPGNELHV